MDSLDRINGNCNTLDNSFGRICIPSKTKYINLNSFNWINNWKKRSNRINGAKTVTKHNSSDCKCTLDDTKCNSN